MHWLTLTHASRWRTSHHTIGYGPLYQGRYKSFAVEQDEHYLTVLRYVERNPLRAKLVVRAQDWAWSSLPVRGKGRSLTGADSGVPDLSPFLHPGPMQLPADWIEAVNRPQTPAEEEAMGVCIRRGRPYGNDHYQKRTAKWLGLVSCFRKPGRPAIGTKKPAG